MGWDGLWVAYKTSIFVVAINYKVLIFEWCDAIVALHVLFWTINLFLVESLDILECEMWMFQISMIFWLKGRAVVRYRTTLVTLWDAFVMLYESSTMDCYILSCCLPFMLCESGFHLQKIHVSRHIYLHIFKNDWHCPLMSILPCESSCSDTCSFEHFD